MSFAQILATAEPLEGGFALDIPDRWKQGRTAYGGFSSALAHECARRLAPDMPPLRSAQVAFVGPVAGRAEFRARILRRGRNASWVEVQAACDGAVAYSATFVFMGPVESALHLHDVPLPAGITPVGQASDFASRMGPSFIAGNFEVRFAKPRPAAPMPEVCWWVRVGERDGLDPMTETLLVADALPPGVLPMLGARVPVSSMTWQANYLTAAPATQDGWWLLQSVGDYAEKGCSSQRMAMWNAAGEAVISGMQSVALFG
ncbi:MAG: thioesterase family protein [Sphingomonadales bacterium]|nr:thioesterase family protein [Sphingomonadales bacterium]MBD3774095.1 thioesterase family protein [Paracoccaceae bacterium]